jgi:hypothetical protein
MEQLIKDQCERNRKKGLRQLVPNDMGFCSESYHYRYSEEQIDQLTQQTAEEILSAVREKVEAEKKRIWSHLVDLAEPDDGQFGAGDLNTHLDDVYKIIFTHPNNHK